MNHVTHTCAPAVLSAKDQQHFRDPHAPSSSLKHPLIPAGVQLHSWKLQAQAVSALLAPGSSSPCEGLAARNHIRKIFPTLSLLTDNKSSFLLTEPQKHFLGTSTSFSPSFRYYFTLLPPGRRWADVHSGGSLQELTAEKVTFSCSVCSKS